MVQDQDGGPLGPTRYMSGVPVTIIQTVAPPTGYNTTRSHMYVPFYPIEYLTTTMAQFHRLSFCVGVKRTVSYQAEMSEQHNDGLGHKPFKSGQAFFSER